MNGLITQAQISHRRISRRPSTPVSVAICSRRHLLATVITGCGSKSSHWVPPKLRGHAGSLPRHPGHPPRREHRLPLHQKRSSSCRTSSKATTALHSLHVNLRTTNITTLPLEAVNADVTNQPEGNGQAVGDATDQVAAQGPAVPSSSWSPTRPCTPRTTTGKYTSVGPAEKIYDPGIVLDKDKGIGPSSVRSRGPVTAGNETIDGVATIKVTGTIDAEDHRSTGAPNRQGTREPSRSPCTSPTSKRPVHRDRRRARCLVRMVLDKDQGHVTITLSNWGAPVTIPNPLG